MIHAAREVPPDPVVRSPRDLPRPGGVKLLNACAVRWYASWAPYPHAHHCTEPRGHVGAHRCFCGLVHERGPTPVPVTELDVELGVTR